MGMDRGYNHVVEIVDLSSKHAEKMPVHLSGWMIHWLREHDVRDLKNLLLEMHSDGEDITGYVPILQELEALEKKLKLSGDLPARTEEDLDPLAYVEEEMKEALA
jgi:hypothetical protein